jgi:hypothetical protein
MLKRSIVAACATAVLALAAGLVTPMAAQAAVYGGVFDPENANYKWFGNHLFHVDDSCLSSDGWKQVNAVGGCGEAWLAGGDLTVINKNPVEVSRTIQFSNFPFIPTSTDPIDAPVWGLLVVGGELVGIDTFEIGAFTFAVADAATHGGDWYLRWSSGQGDFCDLYGCDRPDPNWNGGPAVPSADPPTVFLTNLNASVPNTQLPPSTTQVTFFRVPEPMSLSLVLAALGASWGASWIARRRRT